MSFFLNLAITLTNKVLISLHRSLFYTILCNVKHVQTKYEVKGIDLYGLA